MTDTASAVPAGTAVPVVIDERSAAEKGQYGLVSELEEGARLALDFGKLAAVAAVAAVAASGARVMPVVLQDADSGDVLFIGYANEETLEASLRERIAVLWSTSRNELWRKGSMSGDVLELAEIRVNCEQNSLLYLVRRTPGGACPHPAAVGICPRRLLLPGDRRGDDAAASRAVTWPLSGVPARGSVL